MPITSMLFALCLSLLPSPTTAYYEPEFIPTQPMDAFVSRQTGSPLHDPSKCRENGQEDNDCCALQGAGSCADGHHIYWTGDKCFRQYEFYECWTEATCDDGAMNGDETGTDCGGSCGECVCECPNGTPHVGSDCTLNGGISCSACDRYFHVNLTNMCEGFPANDWHFKDGLEEIFLAQKHVIELDDPYQKLVKDLPTMLKIHVTKPTDPDLPPPSVSASVHLKDSSVLSLQLSQPGCEVGDLGCAGTGLPQEFPSAKGVVEHAKNDASFKAMIPAEWVQPGMTLDVQVGDNHVERVVTVGAPTELNLTKFYFHLFTTGGTEGGWRDGTVEEFTAKLPLKDMTTQKVAVPFPTFAMRPHGGAPAVIASSRDDYDAQTGVNFDSEQFMIHQWVASLRAAGGQIITTRFFYGLIFGVRAGGSAAGFSAASYGPNDAIALHELGHAFGLPHLGDWGAYPYKETTFGVPGPNVYRQSHAGPSWAFDLRNLDFISAKVLEEDFGDNTPGTWKPDPMQGGGKGYQNQGYMFNHFSDYSARHMQSRMEGHYAVNKEGTYYRWGGEAYDQQVPPSSIGLPIEDHVEVYSIMVAISKATPEVNFVYPVIGPYTSGLIRTFDPRIEADRADATGQWCSGTCDYTLRITQKGQQVKYFMLNTRPTNQDPVHVSSFVTGAVNVRASDGAVTSAELLATPSVNTEGLPDSPQVLYSFMGTESPTFEGETGSPTTSEPTTAPTTFPTTRTFSPTTSAPTPSPTSTPTITGDTLSPTTSPTTGSPSTAPTTGAPSTAPIPTAAPTAPSTPEGPFNFWKWLLQLVNPFCWFIQNCKS